MKKAEQNYLAALAKKYEMKENPVNPADEIDTDQPFVNPNVERARQEAEDEADSNVISASDINTAFSKLSTSEEDKHPEKRMRAAWNNFVEKRMPEMRQEFPSLKRSQLLERLHKEFEKSEDNPVYMKKLQE